MISRHCWNKENSFGNTYSNIFGEVPNIEIAHVYLMEGTPDYESVVSRYFHISEKQIFKSVFCKNMEVGEEVFASFQTNTKGDASMIAQYHKMLTFGKKYRWAVLNWARELAWLIGKVDYQGLMEFVKSFSPDVLFIPYNNVFFSNRIALKVSKTLNIPMVLNMEMDHYSLNRISYNPFFWIDRLLKRRIIRKLVNRASFVYVISEKLKQEYELLLKKDCKVLYKIPDLTRKKYDYKPSDKVVHYLFTGNISANRWKSLALLTSELKKYDNCVFDIYTATPISKEMQKALYIPGKSLIHRPVSQNEIIALQNSADVLVHAEAFDKYNKSLVRCAISTKIMDYLSVGRCILAIGPADVASIEYLKNNDLGIIAYDSKTIQNCVNSTNDSKTRTFYSKKAMAFVSTQLDANKLRTQLLGELQSAIDSYKKVQ